MLNTDLPFIIDWTVFMGMHSKNDIIRLASKNFFTENFESTGVVMPLAEVGKCDDVVWGFSREEQDAYYPFMDRLHTEMKIQRVGYPENCLDFTQDIARQFEKLTLQQVLLIAHAHSIDARIFTWNSTLLTLPNLNISSPSAMVDEQLFPGDLESFYKSSLALRVKI